MTSTPAAPPGPPGGMSDRAFVRRALIVALLVALGLVIWTASHALVLLFGAILFAVIFRGLAGLLTRFTRIPETPAVAIVLILLVGIIGGGGWLFGSQISDQLGEVAQRMPNSLEQLEKQLRSTDLGRQIIEQTEEQGSGDQEAGEQANGGSGNAGGDARPGENGENGGNGDNGEDGGGFISGQLADSLGWVARQMGAVAMLIADALAQFLLVLFGAIFLAFQPGLYRSGVTKLVPRDQTGRVEEVLDKTGNALWLWAAGHMAEMVIIGVLTGVGLWLLGVPAPLALGLIAGLLEFIPFAGPVLAAIPGVLIALTVSPELALYTLIFYVVLQQVEGNILLPIIQKKAVALPPVVALFAIVVFGSLFGVIGVLFAVPLAVATLTIVQVLYVKETLNRRVQVEGEREESGD